DAVEDTSVSVAEHRFDAPDCVGAAVDRRRADNEGPFRARPLHGFPQELLDDLAPGIEAPRVARCAKHVVAHRFPPTSIRSAPVACYTEHRSITPRPLCGRGRRAVHGG